jgi:PAS domain S-box-containing protein
MTNLAAAGDWKAVQLRLENQEKELSFLTTSLVEKVDNEVTQERAQALENIQRVQRRVFLVLGLTASLTLLLAGELGLTVTRSITQPLGLLDVSAQALARGEFRQVAVAGKDELATLGKAFNHATRQLRELYEALRISEARFRSLIENSSDLVMVVNSEGTIQYVSPSSERVIGLQPESLLEKSIFEFVDTADLANARNIFSCRTSGTSPATELRFRHADGTVHILEVIASNLIDEPSVEGIVVNARDVTDRKRSEEAIRQLSTRMLRIQEEEQRRIARDVHDSTSQEMTALTLNLGALRKSKESFSSNAREKIAECLVLAKRTARQIRTFSYLLHPPMLDEFGLWAALRAFIEEFRSRSGLRVTLEISPELEGLRLDPNCEMALFRLVQEALANVHRHAGSRTAVVNIEPHDHFIKASVADAGRGIPSKVLKEINASSSRFVGVGIAGMKERVRQVGGHLNIQSGNEGTTVTALIPADEIEPRPSQMPTEDLSQRTSRRPN